jgi:hypothetical protein
MNKKWLHEVNYSTGTVSPSFSCTTTISCFSDRQPRAEYREKLLNDCTDSEDKNVDSACHVGPCLYKSAAMQARLDPTNTEQYDAGFAVTRKKFA